MSISNGKFICFRMMSRPCPLHLQAIAIAIAIAMVVMLMMLIMIRIPVLQRRQLCIPEPLKLLGILLAHGLELRGILHQLVKRLLPAKALAHVSDVFAAIGEVLFPQRGEVLRQI